MKRCIFLTLLSTFLWSYGGFSVDSSRFDALMTAELDELAHIFETRTTSHHSSGARAVNGLEHARWVEATPEQPKGPFYPIRLPSEKDPDLTTKDGGPKASGVVVHVQGQIMDRDGNIIKGAKIEIWQACASGKYDHPRDPNPAAADPHFQYYASTTSDDTGKYIFKTIIPGAYPASPTWWRPPHIHFMITREGFKPLITQMYFDGASLSNDAITQYNDEDLILSQLTPEKRAKLIVQFRDSAELNGKLGVFNMYLKLDR